MRKLGNRAGGEVESRKGLLEEVREWEKLGNGGREGRVGAGSFGRRVRSIELGKLISRHPNQPWGRDMGKRNRAVEALQGTKGGRVLD